MRGHHMMGQMLCCSGAPSEERALSSNSGSLLPLPAARQGPARGPLRPEQAPCTEHHGRPHRHRAGVPLPMIRLHVPVSILLHA